MKDIATDVAVSDQIKEQAILPRSLPATLKRTRNALQGDGALQFVSVPQSLTRGCRLTVHKSVPAVRIHLAPPTSHCEPIAGSGYREFEFIPLRQRVLSFQNSLILCVKNAHWATAAGQNLTSPGDRF